MRKFILGTDWWTDCDDAVAVRLLVRAIEEKKIQVLGVGINACMKYSVASLKAFLSAYGIDAIPIGIDQNATDFEGIPVYQKRLAECMPNVTNADAEDAVRLYRRILAETSGKVEIIEIGFLQVIASVLQSKPDDISAKSGIELFAEKVSKVWVMAGKWDADGEKEHNFCNNTRSRIAGKTFCELCPVPVTFLGWEVGYGVITGNQLDHNDCLYTVMRDHGSESGRHSWDPMLVLMSLIGDEGKAGYKTVAGTASVDAESGKNYFIRSEVGNHKFVIKQRENCFYEEQINRLL